MSLLRSGKAIANGESPMITSPLLYTGKALCPPHGTWLQMYELVEVLCARLKSYVPARSRCTVS